MDFDWPAAAPQATAAMRLQSQCHRHPWKGQPWGQCAPAGGSCWGPDGRITGRGTVAHACPASPRRTPHAYGMCHHHRSLPQRLQACCAGRMHAATALHTMGGCAAGSGLRRQAGRQAGGVPVIPRQLNLRSASPPTKKIKDIKHPAPPAAAAAGCCRCRPPSSLLSCHAAHPPPCQQPPPTPF